MSSPSIVNPANTPISGSFDRDGWLRVLHVVTLCNFAFTQPILETLLRQRVFLHDGNFGWIEFLSLLAILILILPSVFVLLDLAAQHWLPLKSRFVRNGILFVLGFLVSLSLLRPMGRVLILQESRSAWMFNLVVGFAAATLLTALYGRSSIARQWLTWASAGLVVFPLAFVFQMPGAGDSQSSSKGHAVTVTNPVPVVMIVFDEFCGASLMNEQLEIDARQFPNFARLASMSTWCRRATSVHARTPMAVPAILTGRFPADEPGPVLQNYPGNLLQLVYDSKAYDLSFFEPVTRLSPEVRLRAPAPTKSTLEQTWILVKTLAIIYPHLLLPNDTPIEFPEIPRVWFGIAEKQDFPRSHFRRGVFHYMYDRQRAEQMDHVVDCLEMTDRPVFCFAHLVIPHFPWEYYSSGTSYWDSSYISNYPDGALGELGETWPDDRAVVLRAHHRYHLQLGAVDRFIGRVLDRLESLGTLDETLIVVAGDHGVSYRPGHSRRVPDADNLADLMSVPLFVKRPGQKMGVIDDSNVEIIDLFPTILDELGMTTSLPIDGQVIGKPSRRLRKSFEFESNSTIVDPQFPQLESAIRHHRANFGSGNSDTPPLAAMSRPDWLGRRVSEFEVLSAPPEEANAIEMRCPDIRPITSVRGGHNQSPLFFLFDGTIHQPVSRAEPIELAIAVGGTLRDTVRSCRNHFNQESFSFLLSESTAAERPTEIELFQIIAPESTPPKLKRLKLWAVPASAKALH